MKGQVPRVGRNDPCPCGSGKKYKHCHETQANGFTAWQKAGLMLVVAAAIGGLVLAFANRSDQAFAKGKPAAHHQYRRESPALQEEFVQQPAPAQYSPGFHRLALLRR